MIPLLMGAMAGMQVLGGIMQYNQTKAAGKAAAQAGKYEQSLANNRALALDMQAGQERAAKQRAMMAERQQGALISGNARALAAASGASLASPSVIKALADIGSMEDYRVGTVRAQGNQKAANLEYGAALERTGGQAAVESGRYQRDLANSQALTGLIGSAMNAGITGASAMAGGFGGGGGGGGFASGGFQTTPGLLQSGAPMYLKYGFGGPGM